MIFGACPIKIGVINRHLSFFDTFLNDYGVRDPLEKLHRFDEFDLKEPIELDINGLSFLFGEHSFFFWHTGLTLGSIWSEWHATISEIPGISFESRRY